MKGNKDQVYDCTSNNFDGMIAVMSPDDSWVCKWQRISESRSHFVQLTGVWCKLSVFISSPLHKGNLRHFGVRPVTERHHSWHEEPRHSIPTEGHQPAITLLVGSVDLCLSESINGQCLIKIVEMAFICTDYLMNSAHLSERPWYRTIHKQREHFFVNLSKYLAF